MSDDRPTGDKLNDDTTLAQRKRVKMKGKVKARGRRPIGTPDWAPRFIRALAQGHPTLVACELAGIVSSCAYQRRKRDPAFAIAWSEAQQIGTEQLEAEASRRAASGTLKPVFYKGEVCGHVREYSDTLMIFLLKARKPEVYRDQHERGQSTRVNVHVQANLDAVDALNALMRDTTIIEIGKTPESLPQNAERLPTARSAHTDVTPPNEHITLKLPPDSSAD